MPVEDIQALRDDRQTRYVRRRAGIPDLSPHV